MSAGPAGAVTRPGAPGPGAGGPAGGGVAPVRRRIRGGGCSGLSGGCWRGRSRLGLRRRLHRPWYNNRPCPTARQRLHHSSPMAQSTGPGIDDDCY